MKLGNRLFRCSRLIQPIKFQVITRRIPTSCYSVGGLQYRKSKGNF